MLISLALRKNCPHIFFDGTTEDDYKPQNLLEISGFSFVAGSVHNALTLGLRWRRPPAVPQLEQLRRHPEGILDLVGMPPAPNGLS
jgi:hypothetical protein